MVFLGAPYFLLLFGHCGSIEIGLFDNSPPNPNLHHVCLQVAREHFYCVSKAVFVSTSNHFRKCFSGNVGVWLRKENIFSGNYLKLTRKMSL